MKCVGDITKLSKNLNAGSFSYEVSSTYLKKSLVSANMLIVLCRRTLNWKTLQFVLHNVACINFYHCFHSHLFVVVVVSNEAFIVRSASSAAAGEVFKYHTICIVIVRFKIVSVSIFAKWPTS